MVHMISHYLIFLKNVSTLTSYTLLDASTLNPNSLFKMDTKILLLSKYGLYTFLVDMVNCDMNSIFFFLNNCDNNSDSMYAAQFVGALQSVEYELNSFLAF